MTMEPMEGVRGANRAGRAGRAAIAELAAFARRPCVSRESRRPQSAATSCARSATFYDSHGLLQIPWTRTPAHGRRVGPMATYPPWPLRNINSAAAHADARCASRRAARLQTCGRMRCATPAEFAARLSAGQALGPGRCACARLAPDASRGSAALRRLYDSWIDCAERAYAGSRTASRSRARSRLRECGSIGAASSRPASNMVEAHRLPLAVNQFAQCQIDASRSSCARRGASPRGRQAAPRPKAARASGVPRTRARASARQIMTLPDSTLAGIAAAAPRLLDKDSCGIGKLPSTVPAARTIRARRSAGTLLIVYALVNRPT